VRGALSERYEKASSALASVQAAARAEWGDEARDASVPDDGAAAGMVGEMGGAFGGARRVRRHAVATFGRQQRRGRRVSAVISGTRLAERVCENSFPRDRDHG